MLDIPISGIKKIEAIASQPEYISLSQGSIKMGGIPQKIKQYVQELLHSDKTDYYENCWGIKDLRDIIAATLSADYKTTISPTQVIPTHGCIGGLSLLFLTLLEAGDEVIIPEPAYPAYKILAQTSRAQAVLLPSTQGLDVEQIKKATTNKTKIILFSNPWNPLGTIVPKKTILELIAWCEKKGIYLIIDEAYKDFVFSGDFCSSIELVNTSEWVISAHTFSKSFALSGWRIGYLVVSEKIIHALVSMQDALLNCLNNIAQYAALYALKHPELKTQFCTRVLANRNYAMKQIEPLVKDGIMSFTQPDGGFYLFLQTTEQDATNLCLSLLNNAKVGLVPGSAFGESGKPYIRLCFAREQKVLEEGIKRILHYYYPTQ